MAIITRHGNEADFDPNRMRTAEFASFDDSGKIMHTQRPGVVRQLMTVQDAEAMIDEKIEPAVTRAEAAAESAEASAELANSSEVSAGASAEEAETNAGLSQSYAVGTGGVVREGDDTDNAKYYYEQARAIVDVDIATTEKAGIVKPDGVTISVEADGTIHSVVEGGVTGVKGASETEYRSGNVNITAENVGAYTTNAVDLSKAELQVLGWNVPNEMPIKNTLVNGVLTQNVGRVDLGSLNWTVRVNENFFYTQLLQMKEKTTNAYCNGYEYSRRTAIDMSISTESDRHSINSVEIRNDSCTNTTEFLQVIRGKYLYYELATPITHTVPDTSTPQEMISDEWISTKTYAVGEYCIHTNKLWKCLVQNSNVTPTEGTYWEKVNVGSEIKTANSNIATLLDVPKLSHNVPRLVPKDITSYYNDGTLWSRINGTNGFSEFEDIYVGDYFKMSRPITAYERTGQYQSTGSQYVTIASINGLYGIGDSSAVTYNHLVMTPGQGFGGTQHFGRSRINPTHSTVGGYIESEMHTTTLGAVTSSGSTSSTATINQQLYAEFGSHLKTTRELLSNSLNAAGYNRFGTNGGCSNNWAWASCQAVLMSEIEVYGSTVWSSSGYDTGTAKKQLELFAHNTQALNNRTAYYWLKDIASSACFCGSNNGGGAYYSNAGRTDLFVRPRFVLS